MKKINKKNRLLILVLATLASTTSISTLSAFTATATQQAENLKSASQIKPDKDKINTWTYLLNSEEGYLIDLNHKINNLKTQLPKLKSLKLDSIQKPLTFNELNDINTKLNNVFSKLSSAEFSQQKDDLAKAFNYPKNHKTDTSGLTKYFDLLKKYVVSMTLEINDDIKLKEAEKDGSEYRKAVAQDHINYLTNPLQYTKDHPNSLLIPGNQQAADKDAAKKVDDAKKAAEAKKAKAQKLQQAASNKAKKQNTANNHKKGWGHNVASKWIWFTGRGQELYNKPGWQAWKGSWLFENKNRTYATNEWKQVSGKWYHFDNNAYINRGWKHIGNHWYHFAWSGKMDTKGWHKIGGKWFYMNKGGDLYTKKGWEKNHGHWMYSKGANGYVTNERMGKYSFDYNGYMK